MLGPRTLGKPCPHPCFYFRFGSTRIGAPKLLTHHRFAEIEHVERNSKFFSRVQ